ncbi:MAG: alpha-glucan family phosphorylase, partial [Flavobacteriales bacterium]|nr:alpha-glucan family phosphorylase [Flavobacteriales bacterium]
VVPKADYDNMSVYDQDNYDLNKLYEILENEIIPMYYDRPDEWRKVQQNAMDDVKVAFNSDRLADEYYKQIYTN